MKTICVGGTPKQRMASCLLTCSGRIPDVFRRFALLLVCIGLALQGMTVHAAEPAPCPMEAQMQAMLAAGELNPADLPDCCNDPQTWAATGELCKPGVDCGAGPALGMAGAVPLHWGVVLSVVPGLQPALMHPVPVATPWRPPATD